MRRMEPNHLMLQSAVNRLQFWQDQLTEAEAAGDTNRIHECAKFIREYGVLIEEMSDILKDAPK